jgi:Spy/CpxP family protein refolding chaperone
MVMVTAKRARMTGLIMLAIMFAVGALAGAATMRVVDAEEPPRLKRTHPSPQSPNLLDRLELTSEQQAQIDVILERRRAEMEEFWDTHRPTLRAITDSARAELRAVLTPEQRELETQFMEERRKHAEKRDRDRRERNPW